jgi:hypothetical protein
MITYHLKTEVIKGSLYGQFTAAELSCTQWCRSWVGIPKGRSTDCLGIIPVLVEKKKELPCLAELVLLEEVFSSQPVKLGDGGEDGFPRERGQASDHTHAVCTMRTELLATKSEMAPR